MSRRDGSSIQQPLAGPFDGEGGRSAVPKSGDSSLVEPLSRAVEFAALFMHPDGSYGGEYGSRNTYHFYPHGFELLRERVPAAGPIADGFLCSVGPDRRYHRARPQIRGLLG